MQMKNIQYCYGFVTVLYTNIFAVLLRHRVGYFLCWVFVICNSDFEDAEVSENPKEKDTSCQTYQIEMD